MGSLNELQNAKASYDISAAAAKQNLQGYKAEVDAVDPAHPQAKEQIAEIEARRAEYYAGAKEEIKGKVDDIGLAAKDIHDPAEVKQGQAIVDDTVSDLRSIKKENEALKASEGDVLAKADGVYEEKQVEEIPTGEADGTVKSSADAELPAAASSAIASASTKALELAKGLGGMGAMKQVTPQNAGRQLIKPNKSTDDFMMKLTSKQNGSQVKFVVTPTIDESRAANYEHIAPIHHPGTIQVYKNSESRQFNISAKLIARTASEATTNLRYLNLIRGWVMPYYGKGTAESYDKTKLGAPPDILLLDVYGERNISNVPVVLTSYHWVYPDQVDYIPTLDGLPFPTIMDISLSVMESYSPEEYTQFDITKYRIGDMIGAYTFSSNPPDSMKAATQEESGT